MMALLALGLFVRAIVLASYGAGKQAERDAMWRALPSLQERRQFIDHAAFLRLIGETTD